MFLVEPGHKHFVVEDIVAFHAASTIFSNLLVFQSLGRYLSFPFLFLNLDNWINVCISLHLSSCNVDLTSKVVLSNRDRVGNPLFFC